MKADEVVIIGAGPAGMTTAIQLKRYEIPFVLLEQERVGGLLWNANLVENYPGFPRGMGGPKLIRLIEKQMERIGVGVIFDTVTKVSYEGDRFNVETLNALYSPRYLVVASGTRPKPIPIVIPSDARERVYSEVFPLLNEQNKQFVIIGAGDAAFDYALNLIKNRNSVTILNHGREVKCLRLLWNRASTEAAITYRDNTPIVAIELDKTASRLKVQLEAGESLTTDYVLSAIGRVPQLDFVSDSLLEQESELITQGRIYFAGDVQNGLLRQTAISAGDGLRAAMLIFQSIEEGSL